LPTDYGTIYETARIGNYSEGYVKVMGYWLFYRSFGEPKVGTILCIHGGPGGGQDNMTKMAEFADEGYRVAMYDQLGSGKSEKPASELLYTMERYVEEIEGVRQALGLGRVNMFGVSFGGFLNIGYAVKYSGNLESLMTQSGTSSSPLAISEMMRLRSEAPSWVPETMDKCEASNDLHNLEYLKAADYLYRQHTCRLDPLPPNIRFFPLQTKLEGVNFVYRLMWGLHEFYPTGNSKYWDVTSRLGEIRCPTLVTCGEYDEITSKNAELLHQGIRDSKIHIFKGCSHAVAEEDRESFFQVHRDFLRQLR
jgi:proline iminopeptidase